MPFVSFANFTNAGEVSARQGIKNIATHPQLYGSLSLAYTCDLPIQGGLCQSQQVGVSPQQQLIEHLQHHERAAFSCYSECKSAGSACVLDYSGEHNIPMPTNPSGFFQAFPCYMLLRASSLTLTSPYRKSATAFPTSPEGRRKQCVISFLLLRFLFFFRNKEKKMKNYFEIKKFS